MKLTIVNTPAHWRDFHRVPHYIYAKDPHWIAPLENDVEKVFSKDETGNATPPRLWVLYNDKGQPIGRIAAFVDHKRNEQNGTRNGGIGFFECVNNDEAANTLFSTAEAYLTEAGITTIDAPINYGERDKFWGLLTMGWQAPLYHENYHPAYYQRFFESRGYLPHEQIYSFGGLVKDAPLEQSHETALKIRERYNIQSRTIRKDKLEEEAAHIAEVYNAAFEKFPHFKPLSQQQVHGMFKPMKPVMDPNMFVICFVGERPIGFCALMPDLNPMIKFAKGRLSWWKLPLFLYKLHFGRPQIVKGVAFGIHPDYQRKGVFLEMVDHLAYLKNHINPKRYYKLGLATIRGGNIPMMKGAAHALNAYVDRVHISYRRIFDGSPHVPYDFTNTSEVPMGTVPPESIYPKG